MTRYTTLQNIIEDAGLAQDVHDETPNGIADGVNKIFTVHNKPLIDSNYDDLVTAEDIRVYVDGVPVAINTLDVAYGIITLNSAPAEAADVSVDYRYSAVSMAFVSDLRDEAEDKINTTMQAVDTYAPYGTSDDNPVPKTIRSICRQFAAAWLLIRDYGFNQDIEGTSKDGYKRFSTAQDSLKEYALKGGKGGSGGVKVADGGVSNIVAGSCGDLFSIDDNERRPRSDDGW